MAELNEYNANLTMKIKELNETSKKQVQQLQQKEDQIIKLRNVMRETEEIEAGAEKLLEEIKKVRSEKESLNQKRKQDGMDCRQPS